MPEQSPVTRYLLGELLTAIPPFTELEPYRDFNLNNWRQTGSYQATIVTANSFTLAVNNQREYAAALFSDAQHLINQVMEHRAHLVNVLGTGREPSPTWIFVTVYYMALYAAMAFTRASNAAVVYLDAHAVSKFCGNLVGKRPGGGAFVSTTYTNSATGRVEVQVAKYKSHFHEAVWAKSIAEADKAFKWIDSQTNARSPSADELLHMRALNLFRKTKFQSGSTWPSKLRNALNYRPGFSYRSILRNNTLRINSRLAKAPFSDFESLVSYGERALDGLGNAKDPADVANDAVDLIVAYGMILEAYATDALDEVCRLQDLTSSASAQRAQFNRLHCREPANLLMKL